MNISGNGQRETGRTVDWRRTGLAAVLLGVVLVTPSCAAQQGQDAADPRAQGQTPAPANSTYSLYGGQSREQVRANMRQSAQQLGQLASDFKEFYGDLQKAVKESGIEQLAQDATSSGFGSEDIRAESDRMLVHVDLPGVEKKNLSVKLRESRILEITGNREGLPSMGDDERLVKEGRYKGPFRKEIELPYKASLKKKLEAKYENGVLAITVPREEDASSEVSIPIE